ncbi:MAG TPA: ABC transporter ATP-binding protein [Pyrinomonadaceae bacterium]|jgi:iron complex transport system ATP-binding protein
MLEARNISINYGECEVLQNVSFALRAGQTLAALGANGAGKTTLLHALNGFLPVSKGEITLEGKTLREFSRREIARRMSVVAQENETKFPVTVLEFVLAGRFAHGGVFGWESAQDIKVAKNALEMCDLKDYETRLMNRLSGGERQRVVFARALATEAKILLLDEPTANLDLSHQALMFRLVRERCRTGDAAAVIVTHDLNLASEFADEILLLKNGKIAAQGTPDEVLNAETLREVFAVEVLLDENPVSKKRRVTAIY